MTSTKTSTTNEPAAGFTLVELLIASTVFSLLMVLCAMALLQVGKMYYKGVVASRAQEAARTLVEDVKQSIQFQGQKPQQAKSGSLDYQAFVGPGKSGLEEVRVVCIGNQRFIYVLDYELDPSVNTDAAKKNSRRVLIKDKDTDACTLAASATDIGMQFPNPVLTTEARELMGNGMRLDLFEIKPYNETSSTNLLWTIRVRIVIGDLDLIEDVPDKPGETRCKLGAGSQFCAVSDLSTTVAVRQE